jgi:rubrerythrin
MKNSSDIGMNRTGIDAAPMLSKEMIRSSHDELEYMEPDPEPIKDLRIAYAREAGPIGTVPPPATVKGVATTAMTALAGDKASVFVDKLAERLAFERMGTRLYEALLTKMDAVKKRESGVPLRAAVEEIYQDERRHFALVHRSIKSLGADPTAMTPSADLEGVASMGLLQVICDPRTSVREGLQAILHAELADCEGWDVLVALADGFGQEEMVAEFTAALQTEETHLQRVRTWVSGMVQEAAFGETKTPPTASGTRARTRRATVTSRKIAPIEKKAPSRTRAPRAKASSKPRSTRRPKASRPKASARGRRSS